MSEYLHPPPSFTGVTRAGSPERATGPSPSVATAEAAAPLPEGIAASSPGKPITNPMSPVRRPERGRGFAIEVEGLGELGCVDVRGFREAMVAALDARAAVPQRLVVVGPEPELAEWLADWAEDAEQVRRSVTICRRFDGRSIDAVATMCSFGYGVETSLAIESVTAQGGEILRSGVHLKVDVEAVLARHYAEEAEDVERERVDFD